MSTNDQTDLKAQLRQAVADLERSYDLMLEALGNAMRLKHPETAVHAQRVAAFSISIARVMSLNPEAIRVTARGAFLHDMGKLAIPDRILGKTSPLNGEEMEIMRCHCRRGWEITTGIPFLKEPAEIVHSHHENFDGSGYPRGLKGEEIPLGARITAIANALDTITSDQPYRAAQPFSAAIDEILRCSGSQFDPQITKVLLKMPENIWSDLHKEVTEQSLR